MLFQKVVGDLQLGEINNKTITLNHMEFDVFQHTALEYALSTTPFPLITPDSLVVQQGH